MKRPWQLCDTSSSQDKTSRWRCDAMVTRVSHQLRRPSGFQSFTWAHSSILYTCTVHAVQHTCTALYTYTLLVSFSANFLVKKIQWDQFVTSSLKMFFSPVTISIIISLTLLIFQCQCQHKIIITVLLLTHTSFWYIYPVN